MCSTDVYCSSKPTAVAPETITHHFFVSGIGQESFVNQPKCGGAENVVKTETPANILKWIARFYCAGIYTPLEARVYCSQ